MEKRSSYIKDVGITILFGIAISFLGYLFNIYLARHLSQDDFSIYNAAIGIIYLVQIPAITIQAYITQKVAQKIDFDLNSFKRKSIITFTSIGLVLSSAVLLSSPILSNLLNIPQTSIYAISLVLFASLVSPVAKGILFGLQKIVAVNTVMLLETVSKFGLGILAIWFVKDLNIAILANGLPLLLSAIILLPLIKFKSGGESLNINIDFKHLSRVFVSFFLINTPFTLDLLLVNQEFRAEYGALSLIGKIVFFASIMISNTMFAQISNAEGEKKHVYLGRAVIIATVTGLALTILFYLLGESVIEVIFKGQYLTISPYTWVIGIGMTLYAVSYLVTNYLIVIRGRYLNIFLIIPMLLQITLFTLYNESISDVVRNQLVVYAVLLIINWWQFLRSFKKYF